MKHNLNKWNKIASIVNAHESPMDLEKEWAALEMKLKRKKRRRILLYFLCWGGCIGFISFIALSQFNTTQLKLNAPGLPENGAPSAPIVLNLKKNDLTHPTKLQKPNGNVQNKLSPIKTINNNKIPSPTLSNSKVQEVTSIADLNSERHSPTQNIDHSKSAGLERNNGIEKILPLPPKEIQTISKKISINTQLNLISFTKPLAPQKKYWYEAYSTIGLFSNHYKKSNSPQEVPIETGEIKALENFEFGISLGKNINKNWHWRSTLSFQQYQEAWCKTEEIQTLKTLNNQLVETYTNYNGEVVNRYADLTVLETSKIKQTRYNQYDFLFLGIGTGYSYPIKSNGSLQIELGLGTHILLRQHGYFYNSLNEWVPLKDVSGESSRLSYYASASYQLYFKNDLSLLLQYKTNFFHYSIYEVNKISINSHNIGLTIRRFIN